MTHSGQIISNAFSTLAGLLYCGSIGSAAAAAPVKPASQSWSLDIGTGGCAGRKPVIPASQPGNGSPVPVGA